MSPHRLFVLTSLSLLVACGDKDEDPVGGDDGGTEDCTEQAWFLDADGDGHGGEERLDACEAPSGYVAQSTDCDDADGSVNPDASETCDGLDNDCDGSVDEEASDMVTVYADADGDGFGDVDSPMEACAGEAGTVDNADDCDDGDAEVHPDALELCDGLDNDCDGTSDGIAVPGDHDTIQEALDAAADGDLVCVGEGDWDEALSVSGKGVRLGGAGEDATAIIPSDTDESALYLDEAHGVELMDLSMGRLYVAGSEGLYVEAVTITDTWCEEASCVGSGLYLEGSEAQLVDVDVVGNEMGGLSTSQDLYSYGVVWVTESVLDWDGGEVSENLIDRTGKGSFVNGLLGFEDSTITAANLGIHDNGIYSVTNAGTSSNAYSNVQGLIYASGCDVSFEEVLLEDNEVYSQWAPGDDEVGPKGMPAAAPSSYTTSAQSYGWVYASGDAFRWTGGGVVGFTDYNDGGTYAHGYGAYFSSSVLELTDLSFYANDIAAMSSSWDLAVSAGLYSNSSAVQLTRVDFRDNDLYSSAAEAYNYGLLVHWNGTADYDNVVLASNVLYAHDFTTALVSLNYLSETPVLSQLTVHDNDVDGHFVGSGGVHYWNTSGLTVVNSIFSDNSTGGYEADSSYAAAQAIFGQTGGTPDVTYTDFYANSGGTGYLVTTSSTWDAGAEVLAMDGVLEVDPGFADAPSGPDGVEWDLSLDSGSSLVDAGDPSISDPDGSTSDIGAYGGPEGSW